MMAAKDGRMMMWSRGMARYTVYIYIYANIQWCRLTNRRGNIYSMDYMFCVYAYIYILLYIYMYIYEYAWSALKQQKNGHASNRLFCLRMGSCSEPWSVRALLGELFRSGDKSAQSDGHSECLRYCHVLLANRQGCNPGCNAVVSSVVGDPWWHLKTDDGWAMKTLSSAVMLVQWWLELLMWQWPAHV